MQIIKKWLGVTSAREFMADKTQQQPDNETANLIWRVHAALDAVYGKGWSKENPHTVAKFLQALSTKELASEVAAFREIIASGSGGLTVGIEKT